MRGLMVSSLPSLMVLPSWCLLMGLRTASGKKAPASPAQNAPSFWGKYVNRVVEGLLNSF